MLIHTVAAPRPLKPKSECFDQALRVRERDVLELPTGDAAEQLVGIHEREGYT